MKISVIMSVYNCEKYLSQAIESILNQTYSDFEFLIIDDGSKDNSFQIIKKYALKDSRIKIFRNKENIGLTKSLNKAIYIAQGEYIARQDADDVSLPNRLVEQLKFLQYNKDYAFCGCNGTIKQTGKEILKFFNYEEIKKNLIIENCFTHPSIVIRKIIFEKYGYYNEKRYYGQDYELWCRLIYKHQLKAKNLRKQLIILNQPSYSFFMLLDKERKKLAVQIGNQIKTEIIYFKFSENKTGCLKTILGLIKLLLYINSFSKFRKKMSRFNFY